MGDYGDAPDGQPTGYRTGSGVAANGKFPSLFRTANARRPNGNGIVHTDTNPDIRFGQLIDQETDARITNNDASDDGQPTLFIQDGGSRGTLFANLQAAPGTGTQPFTAFVNVLLDLNQDGVWRDHDDSGVTVKEWVVINLQVSLNPGELRRVNLGTFSYGPSSARVEVWSRLTVTSVPIDAATFQGLGGWDGTGPAAGYDDGETEDWFFPCEGRLQVVYVPTLDAFPSRLTPPQAGGVMINALGAIVVTNLAAQQVTYIFAARAKVAVPFGLSYFYVPAATGAAAPFTATLTPVLPLPPAAAITPSPVSLPAASSLVTITLGPAPASITLDLDATVNPANIPTVPDPTDPNQQPARDNRLGLIEFHPLGPCLLEFRKTNDEPIFLQWP
jgi:hypothetical protein